MTGIQAKKSLEAIEYKRLVTFCLLTGGARGAIFEEPA